MLAEARKLIEGTPSPRDFDRGVHRRLQLRIGAKHAPMQRILICPGYYGQSFNKAVLLALLLRRPYTGTFAARCRN